VYTDPAWRRRGVARAVMEAILAWCRRRRFTRIRLHASDLGRPLYESLGFAPTRELGWRPDVRRRAGRPR